jgi:hypothetical protein
MPHAVPCRSTEKQIRLNISLYVIMAKPRFKQVILCKDVHQDLFSECDGESSNRRLSTFRRSVMAPF